MMQAQDIATEQELAATRRERWIVGLVAASIFVSVVNTTMVNVALPTISDRFNSSEASVGWLVTIYSLTFGVGTPFYGRLGDRYGLRRMFVIGLCVFVSASLLAGLAANFEFLIAFRALQAAGSAAIPSLGLAMVARVVPFERRGRSLGLIGAAVGAGSALGPTLGGVLTQFISWRMVFLVSALLGLLIPFCLRFLPSTRNGEDEAIDWVGGISLGLAIAGAMTVVAGIPRQGLLSPLVLVAFVAALLGIVVTTWRHRVARNPFVNRALTTNRRYVLLCLIGFCMMAGNMGALVVAPFLFRDINGLSAGQIGLALLPGALAIALFSRPVGRLAERVDPFRLITTGLFVMLTTLVLLATVGIGWDPIPFAFVLMFLGVGQSLVGAPLSVILTATVEQRVYGVGLGIYNMLFFVGSGFGVALTTAVLEIRRNTGAPFFPIYFGVGRFSEFSDALLTSAAIFATALFLSQLARRSVPPDHPGDDARR